MYSLGSSEALTQFFYQGLGLPFFGDVGEQLSENKKTHTKKHITASKQSPLNSKIVDFLLLLKQVTICPEDAECCSVWTNPLSAKAPNGT